MLSIAPNLLTTQRLILRQWRESDRGEFARLNDDPAVMEFLGPHWRRDKCDDVVTRLQAVIEQRGWGFWAVEVKGTDGAARTVADAMRPADAMPDSATGVAGLATGTAQPVNAAVTGAPFIGFVGLSVPSFDSHFTPCVEIGWRLAKEHWGRGYASEAASACLRFGFERLSLEEIVAFTVPLNKRSRGVMERIGMSRDPADDFDHPKLPLGDPLRRHVLYRMKRCEWQRVCVPCDAALT